MVGLQILERRRHVPAQLVGALQKTAADEAEFRQLWQTAPWTDK